MCYKQEIRKKEGIKLEHKLKDNKYPMFIRNFFDRLKGTKSKLNYFSTLNEFINYLLAENVIEKSSISNISPDDFKGIRTSNLLSYFENLKNSTSTIKQKKKRIQSFFEYLIEEEYVEKNPAISKTLNNIYKDESERKEIKVPTDEQLVTFLSNIKEKCISINSIQYMTIVRLFMGTGIRKEELIGLDITDLYFDNMDKNGNYIPYKFIEVLRKGNINPQEGKSEVQIDEDAVQEVEKWLEIRQRTEAIDKDKNALFVSNLHERMSSSNIDDFFKRYSNGTITPHMLRHWYGTEFYKYTKDGKAVQTQLGHKNFNVTNDCYIKNDKEESYREMNKMKNKTIRRLKLNKI